MTERMDPDVAMGNKIHMCKFELNALHICYLPCPLVILHCSKHINEHNSKDRYSILHLLAITSFKKKKC